MLTRIIEQWDNLKDIFLVFLPKQKDFKKDVETTQRYQTIRKYLLSKTSVLYMSFAVYLAGILEPFIILFQSSKPLVHVLYPAIGDMLFDLMSNFIKKSVLVDENKNRKDAGALSVIDLKEKKHLKSIHEIELGHKSSYQIGLLEKDINLDVVKTEMKMCYTELTEYLVKNLPHTHAILADLQYIHPSKRFAKQGRPAIRRVADRFATVLRGTNFTGLSLER